MANPPLGKNVVIDLELPDRRIVTIRTLRSGLKIDTINDLGKYIERVDYVYV